jgi:hypothetical protein
MPVRPLAIQKYIPVIVYEIGHGVHEKQLPVLLRNHIGAVKDAGAKHQHLKPGSDQKFEVR